MTPDKVQARKMVLAGLLVLTLVTTYKNRQQADPASTFRVFWGVGVVGMFLSLLADFLPQIAGPFSLLIALGSITNGGEQVLENALGVISPRTPAGGGSSSAPSSRSAPRSSPDHPTTNPTSPAHAP